jgi:hypothetical protein
LIVPSQIENRKSSIVNQSFNRRENLYARHQRWFGWAAVTGPIHMGAQLLFGIDEMDELKGYTGGYCSLFSGPNYGRERLKVFFSGGTILRINRSLRITLVEWPLQSKGEIDGSL